MEPRIVKNLLFTSIIILLCTGLRAQERLTDIHNNLHTHFETGYEWNGTQYLISMFATGDVRIFQLKGPEDARLIFEQKMAGVYTFAEATRFYGEWMIFQNGTHQFTFHLTQKKLYSYERPEGFYAYAESLYYDLDYCLLKLDEKVTGYKLYFILDYDKGIERWNGEFGTPLCRNGHEFVCHSFEGPTGAATSRFDVINIKTGEKKLVVKNLNYQPIFNFGEGNYWYVDNGVPVKFDPIDKSLTKYPAAKLSFYSTTSVYIKDDYLIVMGSQIDNYQVVTYDLKKEVLLSSSKGIAPAAGFMTNKVRLFKQYMLCFDAGYYMHQFDYEKGFVKKYKVVFDPYTLSNRVPTLHEGIDYVYNGKGYTYINFASLDTAFVTINAQTLTPATFDFTTFHWADGRVLAVTMSRHLRSATQFLIDPVLKKAEPVNLTQAPVGMNQESRILKVDSTLFLWSDGLYRISDNEVNRLPSQITGYGNSFNYNNNKAPYYKIRNRLIESYTLENDQLTIYQHQGSVTTRCGSLPFSASIYEACCFGNKIFTLEYKNGFQICQYDSSGANRIVVDKFISTRNFTNMQNALEYNYLVVTEKGVLYQKDSTLYLAYPGGLTKAIANSPSFNANIQLLKNNDGMFFCTNYQQQSLYHLQKDNWTIIHPNIKSIRYVYTDPKRDKVTFSINDVDGYTIILTDGSNTKKWTTPLIAIQIAVEDKYVLYRTGKNMEGYLLDLEADKLQTIPALPDGFQYGGLTITQNDTLVYGFAGTSFDYELRTYRLSQHFSTLTQINQYNIPASVNYLFTEGQGNTRLVYTSLFTGKQNEGSSIELLPDLIMGNNITTRSYYANDHFVDKGYLYFLSSEVTNGKQLYRLKMEYPLLSTPDMVSEKITIYPNPGHDQITIQHPKISLTEGRCKIYHSSGSLITDRPYNGQLDIHDLNPGYYIGEYRQQDQVIPFSFIKL
jgi:hypothetical protein